MTLRFLGAAGASCLPQRNDQGKIGDKWDCQNGIFNPSQDNIRITDKNGVTIMGDQEIPYGLLKKIMLTCAGAEYTNISFAVNQKASEG